MLPIHALLPAACLLFAAAPLLAQQDEIVDTYMDGSVRARYRVDAQGRLIGQCLRYHRNGNVKTRANYSQGKKHGPYQEYRRDGTRRLFTNYRDDVVHGEQKEFSEDEKRILTSHYKMGVRHGELTVTVDAKTLTKQVWADGTLTRLNGVAPFSRSQKEIHDRIAAILKPPEKIDGVDKDEALPIRLAALRRLRAYRYLCSLPYENLTLKPEWNVLCDYGARLCEAIGHLDHTPKKPAGMSEEDYRKGYQATSHSNLSAGASMVRSVDNYMNDSDPRNIERVGHRRWCLNPAMGKTGFGAAGTFSAMWSMDASGGGVSGLDAVLYPPPGYVPVGFFGARHAWSISIVKGGQAKKSDAVIKITELDELYLPKGDGKPLELDYLGATSGGPGIGNCLIFRPAGLVVEPGRRYWCEVSLDKGQTVRWQYLVEFTEDVG